MTEDQANGLCSFRGANAPFGKGLRNTWHEINYCISGWGS